MSPFHNTILMVWVGTNQPIKNTMSFKEIGGGSKLTLQLVCRALIWWPNCSSAMILNCWKSIESFSFAFKQIEPSKPRICIKKGKIVTETKYFIKCFMWYVLVCSIFLTTSSVYPGNSILYKNQGKTAYNMWSDSSLDPSHCRSFNAPGSPLSNLVYVCCVCAEYFTQFCFCALPCLILLHRLYKRAVCNKATTAISLSIYCLTFKCIVVLL